jgi:Fe-S-cluster containining protein
LYPKYDKNNYDMRGRCPFLDGNKCSVRGKWWIQPRICRQFKFLGEPCVYWRRTHPELVTVWLMWEKLVDFDRGNINAVRNFDYK